MQNLNFVWKLSTGDSQNEKHTEFKNFNAKIVTKYYKNNENYLKNLLEN